MKVRMGVLDEDERGSIEARVDAFMASRDDLAAPSAARLLIRTCRTALGAPDALHLAMSRRLGTTLATLDRRLVGAAREVGAPVLDVSTC